MRKFYRVNALYKPFAIFHIVSFNASVLPAAIKKTS